MVTEVDVLQHGHSSDFCGSTCKQSACLLCIIAYHHELVVKLRENGFDSLPETSQALSGITGCKGSAGGRTSWK